MTTNPFQVGDRLRMRELPAGVADITVTALGVCDDDQGPDEAGNPTECGKPTVVFTDPQSGEEDEGHAEDFALLQ
jgi:hypothetical protein